MTSPISIDHLTATTTTTTTSTATTNHHDINIDIALLANTPSNTRRNSLSMNGFDSTPTTAAAMPFMFSPHYSRQSSSIPVPASAAASNPDHLLSYPTPDFASSTIASSNPFAQNHAIPRQNNGASLLSTGGEAQVAKTVVIDNLLEKVIRTTQDARDAFSHSRSQDGKQRLAELKAIVDLVVSFASSSAGASKHSPPVSKPFVPVMDPHSHSHTYHHPHPLPAHSHPFGTHHPFQFQPPSQRVSPAPVKKSSSSSRKSSLSGPIPQLLPLSSTTTGTVAPAALEDASRKRCGSPQNDRAMVKSLKLEPKEEPLLPSLAVNNTTVTFADGASPLSSSSSAGSTGLSASAPPLIPSTPSLIPLRSVVPPQLIHSKTYPSASGFHSHPHLHPHPHSHSQSHSHSHSHQHAHHHTHSHELAPLSRISSHPSLDSLASSASISHAALAHQLNFMHQQQQQQQQQQHRTMPIPLEHAAHTHSLSTSHIPTMQSHSHSSFLPTTTNGHGHMQASMASGSDSSLLQSPISVPSSAGSSAPNQPRFHLHPNPSLSALPIPHGGTGLGTGHPPMTRPARSASYSGAFSFSSFDLLPSAGAGASSPGTTTTTNSSPNATVPTDVVIDMAGLVGGAGIGSAIEVPPRPSSSSAANSSSPGSEREDSPGRLYAAAFSGAGGSGPATGTSMGVRATDTFVTTTHQNNELSPELKAEVDRIFFEFMNMVCSDLDAKDNKGEPIHQPLMAKKMQRLDESRDFRPFKFRIQAFTNGFLEELAKQGLTDDIIPMKKVRHYLWTNPYISRFNEDGKKAKSKGNHIWNIDAQKAMLGDGVSGGGGAGGKAGGQGQWIFRPFKRKIAGTFPNIAYIGIHWQFRPRVWDPQASRSNLHHHNHHHHSNQRHGHGQDHHSHNHHQPIRFSSPSLPPWLGWNESGDTLSGTPDSDAQSVEFIIEAKEGEETVLSQVYFLSVAPLTREGSTTFHSCNSMPSASVSGSRNTPIVNDLRVPEPSASSLLSTRSVAASTSTPTALRDALDVVTEAIKAVSLEACTVQASSHAEQVQIQHSLSRQGQVLTSTAHAMNCVMTIASGQHSPSSAADHGGVGGAAVGTEYDAESGEVKDSQTRIEEAASLARAGTDVVICAAQKVAADHHRSAAATIFQMSSTGGGISELESMELQNLNLNLNLNAPIVTMEELSTTTKSAVAEAVEMTDTTASPIDVMLTAETIIQQNTQPLAVPVTVPPLLATSAAAVAPPPPFSLHGHGLASPFDMSNYDYPMNDMTSS